LRISGRQGVKRGEKAVCTQTLLQTPRKIARPISPLPQRVRYYFRHALQRSGKTKTSRSSSPAQGWRTISRRRSHLRHGTYSLCYCLALRKSLDILRAIIPHMSTPSTPENQAKARELKSLIDRLREDWDRYDNMGSPTANQISIQIDLRKKELKFLTGEDY